MLTMDLVRSQWVSGHVHLLPLNITALPWILIPNFCCARAVLSPCDCFPYLSQENKKNIIWKYLYSFRNLNLTFQKCSCFCGHLSPFPISENWPNWYCVGRFLSELRSRRGEHNLQLWQKNQHFLTLVKIALIVKFDKKKDLIERNIFFHIETRNQIYVTTSMFLARL